MAYDRFKDPTQKNNLKETHKKTKNRSWHGSAVIKIVSHKQNGCGESHI